MRQQSCGQSFEYVESKTPGASSRGASVTLGGRRTASRSLQKYDTGHQRPRSVSARRSDEISHNLSDYQDLGMIGKGQFGTVHKVCLKSAPDKLIVWKQLNYRKMPDKEKRQLQQEVRLLQELDHPNVVR
eukprot:Selendium_serpulae@DN10615_c0_g1_i1.p1